VDARILLVEDDPSIREITTIGLRNAGFEVDAAADGQAGLDRFRAEPYDLILLDVMLPRLDGLEVCRAIRRVSTVPVVMLTARADTIDVVVGLEAGADDYVKKPFEVPELVARVRAAIRRAGREVGDPDALRLGTVAIDLAGRTATRDGRDVALTRTEFDLLVELARNPGRVLSRDVLLDRIWGYDYLGDSRLVDVAMQRLRAKVEADPASPVLGATVAKLRALAARVDELVVLADSAVDGVLPENCRVRLFRSGNRAGRGLRFENALSRELVRRPRPGAVLAHMCPIYAVLAAPLARPLGVPVLLWFTHWRRSRLLSTAERLSTLVLSVDQRTFPLDSKKVVAIGHGIDVSDLECIDRPSRDELTLLALGRTSPAKGLETIIRAVALVPDVRLLVIGPSLTEEERLHKLALERLVIDLGLLDRVDIRHAVPRHTVPGLYAEVDALVNDMREGAADKVVYEAAATCMPVLASNPAFDTLLPPELRFESDDIDGLALAIVGLLSANRNAIGHSLREIVVREHSVDTWADRVVELSG